MKMMPIVYVTDMQRASVFYQALGFVGEVVDRASMWTQMTMGDAILGLHYIETLPEKPVGRVELALVTTEPLEHIVNRLASHNVALYRQISDEAFGRSIQVRDPDGLVIQINEHDESLYT